jgi:cytochrome b561
MTGPKGYSAAQIGLHWIIAVLIGLQFLFNEPIGEAFEQIEEGAVPAFSLLVWGHIAGGVVILLLVLWRVSLRLSRGVPASPDGTPPLLHMGAAAGHLALYALMLLVPVSGLVAWFGGVEQAAEGHEVMTTLLLIVVGLHVAAALYHQFIRKDHLLLRMMRPGS